MTALASATCLVAAGFAVIRWLRVAQREHYLPGQVSRFALRWWWGLGFNRLLLFGVVVNLVLTFVSPFFAFLVAAPVVAGPFGLKLRGTAPGKLAWTRRLKTLAGITAALTALVVGAVSAAGLPAAGAAMAAVLMPSLIDAALAIAEPLERRLGRPFVEKATRTLRDISPLTIAITGSYGKTTTKGYVAHLIEGTKTVVPSPRSFNNSAGLARAVNEQLTPGTDVFVAEMGTYGPGEIEAMVEWVRPAVAAITAIGPVHLERMKTEERIVEAKAEIFGTAAVAILNVDDDRLAALADRLETAGTRVIRCSGRDVGADVTALSEDDRIILLVGGREVAAVAGSDAVASNVAVAAACAMEAGVPAEQVGQRLHGLPAAPNRQTVTTATSGATIIDDTYNANPAGAKAALRLLEKLAEAATTSAVVTPGMIELGGRQADENERFAAAASEIVTDILIVGMTNRSALLAGAHQGRARVHLMDDRAQAVAWVRENLVAGDVVLYENDLPDHFP